MARPFKICPDCGAHLDASEPCDCKDAIEREPPKPRERLKLLAVCREVDKESGRVSVYPLDLEITSEILASLKMRAQFNPELRYFTTTTARWDRYGEVMAGRAGRLGLQQSAGKRAGPNLPGVRPAVVLHYAACYLGGGHNALFDLGV